MPLPPASACGFRREHVGHLFQIGVAAMAGGRLCSTVAPFGGNEAETWRYWLKVRVAVTSTDEDVDVLEALLPVDVTHRRRRNF